MKLTIEKNEPFWEVRVAVSLARLAAAPPPAREKAEVAAGPARPPIREAGVIAELAAFELPSPAAATRILHLCCRRRPE